MKTFNEWSTAGYKINKGAKGQKIGGQWYFSEQQVTYSPRRSTFNSSFRGCSPKGGFDSWSMSDEEDMEYHQIFGHNA